MLSKRQSLVVLCVLIPLGLAAYEWGPPLWETANVEAETETRDFSDTTPPPTTEPKVAAGRPQVSELWTEYLLDPIGSSMPDYSHAGYRGGGVPLVPFGASTVRITYDKPGAVPVCEKPEACGVDGCGSAPGPEADQGPYIECLIGALGPEGGTLALGQGRFVLQRRDVGLRIERSHVRIRGEGAGTVVVHAVDDGDEPSVLLSVGRPQKGEMKVLTRLSGDHEEGADVLRVRDAAALRVGEVVRVGMTGDPKRSVTDRVSLAHRMLDGQTSCPEGAGVDCQRRSGADFQTFTHHTVVHVDVEAQTIGITPPLLYALSGSWFCDVDDRAGPCISTHDSWVGGVGVESLTLLREGARKDACEGRACGAVGIAARGAHDLWVADTSMVGFEIGLRFSDVARSTIRDLALPKAQRGAVGIAVEDSSYVLVDGLRSHASLGHLAGVRGAGAGNVFRRLWAKGAGRTPALGLPSAGGALPWHVLWEEAVNADPKAGTRRAGVMHWNVGTKRAEVRPSSLYSSQLELRLTTRRTRLSHAQAALFVEGAREAVAKRVVLRKGTEFLLGFAPRKLGHITSAELMVKTNGAPLGTSIEVTRIAGDWTAGGQDEPVPARGDAMMVELAAGASGPQVLDVRAQLRAAVVDAEPLALRVRVTDPESAVEIGLAGLRLDVVEGPALHVEGSDLIGHGEHLSGWKNRASALQRREEADRHLEAKTAIGRPTLVGQEAFFSSHQMLETAPNVHLGEDFTVLMVGGLNHSIGGPVSALSHGTGDTREWSLLLAHGQGVYHAHTGQCRGRHAEYHWRDTAVPETLTAEQTAKGWSATDIPGPTEVLAMRVGGGQWGVDFRVNGVAQSSVNSPPECEGVGSGRHALRLGGGFQGQVRELLVFGRVLDEAELSALECYLADKNELPVPPACDGSRAMPPSVGTH